MVHNFDVDHVIYFQCAFIYCLSRFTKLDEELMSMVVNNCRHIVCNALDWRQETLIKRQSEVCYFNNQRLIHHSLPDLICIFIDFKEGIGFCIVCAPCDFPRKSILILLAIVIVSYYLLFISYCIMRYQYDYPCFYFRAC